jgi:hypothetical protein
MSEWPRLVSAEPIGGYKLRLHYSDGFVGEVDFSETVDRGGIFAFLRNQERFKSMQIAHLGQALVWVDDEGDDVDFCADALRMQAEANAVKSMAE